MLHSLTFCVDLGSEIGLRYWHTYIATSNYNVLYIPVKNHVMREFSVL